MKPKDVEKAKKSVMKVMGVHTAFNYTEPYLDEPEAQYGGTAFFFDVRVLGKVPFRTKGRRFLFTNFHVVDNIQSKTCELSYPSKGMNRLTASIIHVVPSLDCAILCIDPSGTHPAWRDGGNISLFLEGIPNLKMDTDVLIKGNSQDVLAIGFPSLSADYQLCEGCVSGRGMGMLQLNLSLNGGNSGGPLFHKNKVIGICTASEADTEAIGLAVPIQQIVRFFNTWADFKHQIMKLPSWGMQTEPLSDDYLAYYDIQGMQGALIKQLIKNEACSKAGLEPKDIIMGINSGGKRYNIDYDGLVQVDWTDKRVPIHNSEFVISLDPEDIEFQVYKHKKKKVIKVNVTPNVIDFKTYEKHHVWDDIDYATFAGTVWMELTMNHLEEYEDEDVFMQPTQAMALANEVKRTLNMEHIVVCTHIPGQTYIDTQRILKPFDVLKKINRTKVKNVAHMQELLIELAKNIDDKRYVIFETQRCKCYFDLQKVATQELLLSNKFEKQYFLQNIKRRRKRTRTMI